MNNLRSEGERKREEREIANLKNFDNFTILKFECFNDHVIHILEIFKSIGIIFGIEKVVCLPSWHHHYQSWKNWNSQNLNLLVSASTKHYHWKFQMTSRALRRNSQTFHIYCSIVCVLFRQKCDYLAYLFDYNEGKRQSGRSFYRLLILESEVLAPTEGRQIRVRVNFLDVLGSLDVKGLGKKFQVSIYIYIYI